MRVLITGAGGNLGRVLAPALAEQGHEPILMDYRPIVTPYRSIQGDVTRQADVREAVRDIDAIVHAAALHGIHQSNHSRDAYWELNVTGTYYVYEAAKAAGVKQILLCSTMGVYGESAREEEGTVNVVTEERPLLPRDFYGESKRLCEDLAEFYSRNHGIKTIAYRLGMFVPESFIRYGFRLLKGGVDDRDVSQAFLLGLSNETILFDAFNVMAEVPFSMEQLTQWKQEPAMLLKRDFPGIEELVETQGENLDELARMWGFTYWSIDKAKRVLGYTPHHNFPDFYNALKAGNEAYYPYANIPWWGV
jgi:UDP-glucose 4-epimerase